MSKVLQRPGKVLSNKALTDKLYLLEVEVEDIPTCLKPGQFIHLKVPGMEAHILRRPFSVFYVNEQNSSLVILYQVVGFGTSVMTGLVAGNTVDLMGPIGNGWKIPQVVQDCLDAQAPTDTTDAKAESASSASQNPSEQATQKSQSAQASQPFQVSGKNVLLVAGGVGGAPLYLHAQELIEAGFDVSVIVGAQTKDALVVLDKYKELAPRNILIATDDGSMGHKGFVTDLVKDELANNKPDYLACCGPEPMMKIVSGLSLDAGVATAISLEKRMACGIGCCLSCVVSTTDGRKRACVDGPVFDAAEVIWDED